MSTERKKTLGFVDILLMSFAAFMSLELISSLATMGPSLIFSMIVLGLAYAVPHALLCAELGSTYPEQGGIYVWVKKAFGAKWAARSTWFYWVNVLAFVPTVLIVMGSVFQALFMPEMSVWGMVWFCIIVTWIMVLLNCMSLSISKWVTNIGSIAKFLIVALLLLCAIYKLITGGSQTTFTISEIIPKIDLSFFALVPVFVYSLTGLDVISCSAGEMQNPKKDVPRATLMSIVISIALYIIAACAVLIILPLDAGISEASGLIDSFIAIFGAGSFIIPFVGVLMLIGLFSYAMGWVIGGTKAAQESAEAGELSKMFALSNKHGSPFGASILTGAGSTILLLSYGFIARSNEGLFWSFLAFASILFFLPYVFMGCAFIKLRATDKETIRPFRIPGSDKFGYFIAVFNLILLLVSIVFYFIPPEGEEPVLYMIMLGVGIIIFSGIGEFIVRQSLKKNNIE